MTEQIVHIAPVSLFIILLDDILNNLKKEHGKTAITKALETLAADNRIIEKVYGKQKETVEYSNDQLDEMDNQINTKKENLINLNIELKLLSDGLNFKLDKIEINQLKTQKSVDELKKNPSTVTKEERDQ
ncbi:hypothetical protein MXB_3858, partial [Myxobolus squamalis]